MARVLFTIVAERETDDYRVDANELRRHVAEVEGLRVLNVTAKPAEPYDGGYVEALEMGS